MFVVVVVDGNANNSPEDKKSKGGQNGDDDAREDDRIGVESHLSAPPGEKPLQPAQVRFGVRGEIGGNIPANDESVCGLHSNLVFLSILDFFEDPLSPLFL